jgi:hypothetical protein
MIITFAIMPKLVAHFTHRRGTRRIPSSFAASLGLERVCRDTVPKANIANPKVPSILKYQVVIPKDSGSHFWPSGFAFARDTQLYNGARMKDFLDQLGYLEKQADDCDIVASLSTDEHKRQIFKRLADNYRKMAANVRAEPPK